MESNNSASPILFFNLIRLRIELSLIFSSPMVTREASINGIIENKNSNGAITCGNARMNAKQDAQLLPLQSLQYRKK